MSDIFNEVDDEVRRERLAKLWKQYGNLIVAAVFVVIASVAAWRGYDYWQNRLAGQTGVAYDDAAKLAEQGKHEEAETAFAKIAADGAPGYRVLAELRQAGEVAGRDSKAAIAAYDKIASETTGQPLASELASVRAGFLLVDTAKFNEMTQRLEPLAQPSGAFRHSARELLALSAWHNGDTAAARRWADAAKNDPEAPQGVRSRMDVLASILPADAGKPSGQP